MIRQIFILPLALILCAAAVAGCGRKGPLEPPPSAQTDANVEAGSDVSQSRPAPVDRPFILDPLIR